MTGGEHNGAGSAPASARADECLPPIPAGIFCPDCGYDLRGLTRACCPECGFELAAIRSAAPQIPWSRRRELGRFRAYWQTVWQVGRVPRQICLEVVRPVSYPDARRFRWITFLLAWGPILIGLGILAWAAFLDDNPESALVLVGINVGLGVFLFALPNVAAGLVDPRELPVAYRTRVVALNYYAWAPLALMPLAAAIVAIGLLTRLRLAQWPDGVGFYLGGLTGITGLALVPALIVLSELRLEQFAWHLLPTRRGRWLARLFWLNVGSLLAVVCVALILAGLGACGFMLVSLLR